MGLFIRKSIEALQAEAKETGSGTLKRVLGPVSLVALGVGVIIGAGLFSITGTVAASYTGPAITLPSLLQPSAVVLPDSVMQNLLHDSGIRECLYLLLRHHGRTYCLDYRMGLSIGIYRSSHYCQYQLEPLHDRVPARSRH